MNEPGLALEARPARGTFLATGGESVVPALIKLLPAGREAGRLPLHLTILVERGPGMAQEGRLEAVLQAVRSALEALAPTDRVAIAVYGDLGKLVLGAEPLGDGQKARRLLGFLDAHQVGQGANLAAGLKAIAGDGPPEGVWARRVLVFSAGAPAAQEAAAEQAARALAEAGAALTFFGLGTAWNAPFYVRLADASRGAVHHVARLADLAPLLREELAEAGGRALADVRLRLRFARGVRLRRFLQVFPTVAHWLPRSPSEREAVVRVGDLDRDRPNYLLAELLVPPQAPGEVRLATLNAIFSGAGGRQGFAPAVDLVATFGDAATPAWPEVAYHEGAFHAYVLVERALEARRAQQADKARALLENARRLAGDRPLAAPLADALAALAAGAPFTDTLALALMLAARQPE